MPRNTQGGTGHKKLASKDCVKRNTKTRLANNEDYEYYAQVSALIGGRECHVLCQDGIMRLCHIRGKFSGKNKRDNILVRGIWVLVGLREFETKHEGAGQVCATSTTGKLNKLDKCDLLEIYNDKDKDYLKAVISSNLYSCFTNENSNKNQEICFDNSDSGLDLMMLGDGDGNVIGGAGGKGAGAGGKGIGSINEDGEGEGEGEGERDRKRNCEDGEIDINDI